MARQRMRGNGVVGVPVPPPPPAVIPPYAAMRLARHADEPVVEVRHPLLALWAMLAGAALVMTSVVIAIAALPVIGRELNASQTELQWIVDITPTMLAASVLTTGGLLDRYGRRRGLIVGFTILAAALAWSGLADSATEMLVARFFTGIGAGIVFPGTLATLTSITPEPKRPAVVGYWSASTLGGGTTGFIIAGGFLETSLPWGSFFIFTGAVSVLCLLATLIAVPETRDARHARLDPVGALLSLIGIGGLVVAIIEVPVRSFDDPLIYGSFAAAVVALVAFVFWELRHPHPMLDMRLFKNPKFAGGFAAIVLLFVAAYGWFFLSFQYFSYALGYGALATSAGMIPNALSTVPSAALGPRLGARFGWRPVTVISLFVMATGTALMAMFGSDRDFALLSIAFFVFGIGLGAGQSAPTQAIVESLPRAKQGIASAVNDVSRELGAAIGIAMMGSISNAAYRSHVDEHASPLAGTYIPLVRDSPAVGEAAADQAGPVQEHVLEELIATATVAGWEAAFIAISAVLAFTGLLIGIFGGDKMQARVMRRREAPVPPRRESAPRAEVLR